MAGLDAAVLGEVGMRVFRDRSSTLEAEGRAIDRATLAATVLETRQQMQATLAGLPGSAFERQPDDADGNEV